MSPVVDAAGTRARLHRIHHQRAGGLEALDEADTVIVPGYYPLHDPSPAVVAALRSAAERGTRIASICIGAFALPATGLLDGRTATTHWQEADHFRSRFPAVRLNPDVLYVDGGQLLTSRLPPVPPGHLARGLMAGP